MVTEEEWSGEITRSNRLRWLSVIAGLAGLVVILVPCMVIAQHFASGVVADFLAVGMIIVISLPLGTVLVVMGQRQQERSDQKVRALNQDLNASFEQSERLNAELNQVNIDLNDAIATAGEQAVIRDAQVQRQRFESRLANALDMAEGEPEVIDVIERSLAGVMADAPVELLLADNSHAHLRRMAAVGREAVPPSCNVDSPDRCPAARRAQTQVFPDSEDLDACPKLRDRAEGRLSAVCVPVSIMGRTVGVIHATGKPGVSVEDSRIDELATLAKLAGARIGLLRVMAETQLQASTDSLTGLLNRRSFTERLAALPDHLYPVAVAMVDLDHFKALNDTHGHDTGDHALRLFARVLRDSLRTSDIVARHGGEEFAIAFPDCSSGEAARALNTLSEHLDAAIVVGGLPKFTASIGLTDSEPGENLESVLRRADDALMQAKRQGRDRVIVRLPSGAFVSNHPGDQGVLTRTPQADLPVE